MTGTKKNIKNLMKISFRDSRNSFSSKTRKSYTYSDKLNNNIIALLDKKLSKELTSSFVIKNKLNTKDIPEINKEYYNLVRRFLKMFEVQYKKIQTDNSNSKIQKLFIKTLMDYSSKYFIVPLTDILKTSKTNEETISRLKQMKRDIEDIKYIIIKEINDKMNGRYKTRHHSALTSHN